MEIKYKTATPGLKYIADFKTVNGRQVPVVRTRLSAGDRFGALLARLGIGRMNYRVKPGLYGVGDPGPNSPVFASANYKMSFDALRGELSGIDAWILVLDTRGINVWCAAGKGTFGTKELVRQIVSTELFNVVGHHEIIVPQLGAVGVSAQQVTSFTKFRVVYGPVRASDIKEYLNNGRKKTDEMRRVRFGLKDRAVLIPLELVMSWPSYLIIAAVFLALGFISSRSIGWNWAARSLTDALPAFAGVLSGCVLAPLLLPIIPFQAFSLKGFLLGALLFLPAVFLFHYSLLNGVAVFLIMTSLSAFYAMNFTGSSTFTNLSGAELEVKFGTPVMAGMALAGLAIKTLIAFKIAA